MRLTFADVKNEVGIPSGLCGDNDRLLSYLNEASELLWYESDWPGKHPVYKVKLNGECNGARILTWPRQLETIEAIALCSSPIPLRDSWFEYLEDGVGMADEYAGNMLSDIGEACTFEDVPEGYQKLKVYCDVEEAVGATIRLLGHNKNGDWVRTQDSDGAWMDGEVVAISAAAPVVTENFFESLEAVQKTVTNGNVRLYALNTATLTETPLAVYEYDETRPVYRRSILSGIACSDCACVRVKGKRRFIPIVRDTDYVYPAHTPALKMAVMACVRRDAGDVAGYAALMQQAKYAVFKKNVHHRGQGAVRPYRFAKSAGWSVRGNVQ